MDDVQASYSTSPLRYYDIREIKLKPLDKIEVTEFLLGDRCGHLGDADVSR